MSEPDTRDPEEQLDLLPGLAGAREKAETVRRLSLIHISEPTRPY